MGISGGRRPVTDVKGLARECGFELAGVAAAEPLAGDMRWYREWIGRGYAGRMSYLAGHRAEVRADPRRLLASARSILCVGKLYNTALPYSTAFDEPGRAWISRYAWGEDYHEVMRRALRELVARLEREAGEPFEWKICVDTAPLLERSYARRAGLGWIGKNTCLISQSAGSWFFLAEVLVSLALSPDAPPPGRCGSCRRCVDACPTGAIVPTGVTGGPGWTVDASRCISYLTIELHDEVPAALRAAMGRHVFGCDICQEVCPWNRRAPVTGDPAFTPRRFAPALDVLEALDEDEFRRLFADSPVGRTGFRRFQDRVAVARANARR